MDLITYIYIEKTYAQFSADKDELEKYDMIQFINLFPFFNSHHQVSSSC